MIPLQEQLRKLAAWLFEAAAFRVLWEEYDDVLLQSAEVRLRFVRDRGQSFAYLASLSDPEKWWDQYFILEAITGVMPPPEFEPEAIVLRLRNNFPELVEAMGPKLAQTTQALERRMQERAEELRKGRLGRLTEPSL